MPPDEVAKDVRDNKHQLTTTQAVLDHIHAELARYNDKYLAQFHERHGQQHLLTGLPTQPVMEQASSIMMLIECSRSHI